MWKCGKPNLRLEKPWSERNRNERVCLSLYKNDCFFIILAGSEVILCTLEADRCIEKMIMSATQEALATWKDAITKARFFCQTIKMCSSARHVWLQILFFLPILHVVCNERTPLWEWEKYLLKHETRTTYFMQRMLNSLRCLHRIALFLSVPIFKWSLYERLSCMWC